MQKFFIKRQINVALISLILIFSPFYTSLAQISIPIKFKSFKLKSNYKITQVIDARLDKSNVGLIINSKKEKIDTVNLNFPIEDFFIEMFKNDILSDEGGEINSLILKINYLEFNKRLIKSKTRYWVFCDFEIYKKDLSNSYIKIYENFHTIEGIPDIGHKNDSDQLQFWKLNWFFWDDLNNQINSINSKFVNSNDKKYQIEKIDTTYIFPEIFITDSLKIGNYKTFKELANNNPSIKLNNQKGPLFTSNSTNSNMEIAYPNSNYIGHSDGKNIFINYENSGNFLPIERLGTVFEISGYAIKVYNLKHNNSLNYLGTLTSNAFPFSTTYKNDLVLASGINVIYSILKDSSRSRYTIDTKKDGKINKIPVYVLLED